MSKLNDKATMLAKELRRMSLENVYGDYTKNRMQEAAAMIDCLALARPAGDVEVGERQVEAAARALYLHHNGPNPDWPIGISAQGYHQEPYVGSVPGWKWFHDRSARIALEAALTHPVGEPTDEQIEAAAKAIHRTFWLRTYGDEIGTGEAVIRETWPAAREKYRAEAEAGLRAAFRLNQSFGSEK